MTLPSEPRIGIVLLSAVGDVVHALPVVHAIKRAHPRARITWLLQDAGAALLEGHPAVDEILLFRRKAGLAGFIQMARQLRDRPFDVVLDLQCYFKATVLTALCRSPVKIGLDPARAREFNWVVNNHHPQATHQPRAGTFSRVSRLPPDPPRTRRMESRAVAFGAPLAG